MLNIARNLRRYRIANCWTQRQVAERAGMSRIAYGNIEAGDASPRIETLVALAGALDVAVESLLVPARQLTQVRFRATKKLAKRDAIIEMTSQRLEDYVWIENQLNEFAKGALSGFQAPGQPGRARAEAAAQSARAALKVSEDAPIRDICGLLEDRARVKVLTLPIASEGFFGLSVGPEDGGPAVVVNTWDRIPVERWIFSAAHELGHILLHLSEYKVQAVEEDQQQEDEANRFASEFLMPDSVFWREWNGSAGLPFVHRVLKTKLIFQVSYKTVLFRLAEKYGPEANVWTKFQMAYRKRSGGKTLRLTDEPDALGASDFHRGYPESSVAGEPERLQDTHFTQDRFHRLVRQAFERGLIDTDRAQDLLRVGEEQFAEIRDSWKDDTFPSDEGGPPIAAQ